MFKFLCLVFLSSSLSVFAAKLPKENVIDVPSVSEGLCLHNVFQSNMVIQRGKPVKIWGWAAAGEKVTVKYLYCSSVTWPKP